MEVETPSIIDTQTTETNEINNSIENSKANRKSLGEDEEETNRSIHGFNASNVTVIERLCDEKSPQNLSIESKGSNKQGDGSDSGVEVVENCGFKEEHNLERTLSNNSGGYVSSNGIEECTLVQSCNSSLISCCSNYEDAYNLLARKNSTILEDLKLSRCDGTSEGGSESSSVTGCTSFRQSKRVNSEKNKKKVALNEPIKISRTNNNLASKNRANTTTNSTTPRNSSNQERLKSKERNLTKSTTPRPSSLKTTTTTTTRSKTPINLVPDSKKDGSKTSRAASATRNNGKTPVITPTDDGRWPSNCNSKLAHSFRAGTNTTTDLTAIKVRASTVMTDSTSIKTLDKYATLPRRRREKSADNQRDLRNKPPSRDPSENRNLRRQQSRENTPGRSLPAYPKKKVTSKTRIYHEVSAQTCLTISDVENALAGIGIVAVNPYDVEKTDREVQVDMSLEKVELLEGQLKLLQEINTKLFGDVKEHKEKIANIEQILAMERVEKQALKDELAQNMQRVQTILGNSDDHHQESENDSLLVLESRYNSAGHVIIKQENEISELHSLCRTLQRDLEKSLATQKYLLEQQKDLEAESTELQEFMQAEKSTLSEALHEAESKMISYQNNIIQRDNELERQQDECKHLVRISEQRRQENLALQARLGALESRSRDLLLHQGAAVSGAAVALSGLISRIDVFVEQLITSYNISNKDLEDVIFHNEAYSNSNSSTEGSPVRSKRSPDNSKKDSSFVSAVISAIKNAAAQSPFSHSGKFNIDDRSDSTEMLDSETEPCLMMESVLEDVPIPDGYSHNMISSGHSLIKSGMLGRSESLHNLSQAILSRQLLEQARLDGSLCDSMSYSDNTSLSEIYPTVTLVDQVIEADNLLTKLLKVLRIIHGENDNCINDLQDEKTELTRKLQKQRDTNEQAAQQLKDWEVLGAHLKLELQDYMAQLSAKTKEYEDVKADLQGHRQQIERLNQDVCELSTACSKAEMQLRTQDEQAAKILKEWQETGQMPTVDVLSKLTVATNELPILKEKLTGKEKQLEELQLEFQASRQVMSENWNQAVTEARKQYEAIDTALETLHSIQNVVQQCPPLAKLQHDLEETSFHCASTVPYVSPNFNTNAGLLLIKQQQVTAINSTA